MSQPPERTRSARRAIPQTPVSEPGIGTLAPDLLAQLRSALLDWFTRHQRDLPWRRNPTPYAVWVSEMMLQQTQVTTVLPYFGRWMQRFTSLEQLASADEAEVLAHWQGLGYYSRARNLHRGARYVVQELGGELPRDAASLSQLPGIGPYTAGAISSIAFEEDAAIVDGNVIRVLCRLFALHGSPLHAPLKQQLWQLAQALIPPGRARDFNQALMELGALVCVPQNPNCGSCPLRAQCRAFAQGEVKELPTKTARPAPTAVESVACVIQKGTAFLLVKLPDSAPRWAGMWQFPSDEVKADESLSDAAHRVASQFAGKRGTLGAELFQLKHSVTRFRITLHAMDYSIAAVISENAERRWVSASNSAELAMPAAQRKLISLASR